MKNFKYYYSALIIFSSILLAQRLYSQTKTLKGRRLNSQAIDRFIKTQMDSLQIPALSLAIINNGKMVYYHASGIKNGERKSIDTNTLFEAASITKTIFAYAVHRLVLRHVLNLDTPLYKYYPYKDIEYDDRYKSITARMVLSHTTGFPNWRNGSKLLINSDPGTKFGYSGEGYEYLGKVVAHLTGKKLEDLIQEEVFAPFAIKNSYLIKNAYVQMHLADGLKDNKDWGQNRMVSEPGVAFSLYTEAKEYAKFLSGLIKESSSLASVFQDMSVPQLEASPGKSICLGVFSEQTPFGVKFSHSGNNNNRYNSNFEFYKDSKIGFVFFMNCHKEPQFTKRLNQFLITGK